MMMSCLFFFFLSVLIGQMNLFSVEMTFLIFGELFLKIKVLS